MGCGNIRQCKLNCPTSRLQTKTALSLPKKHESLTDTYISHRVSRWLRKENKAMSSSINYSRFTGYVHNQRPCLYLTATSILYFYYNNKAS